MTQYGTPTNQPVWPPAAPKKRRTWLWAGLAVAAVLAVCGIGSCIAFADAVDEAAKQPAPGQVRATAGSDKPNWPPADDAPAKKRANYRPKPADFKLTVKVLSKKCFGSAGCNVSYRVEVGYVGASQPSPEDTWRVTYAVSGVEDGPQVNSFILTGDQYSIDEEEFAQTKSSKAKLTAKVTDIIAD